MPVRICRADELTPHGRGRKPSAIEESEDFIQLKTKLANGLKRYEAVEVELAPNGIKTHRELFKRRVVKYLATLHMEAAYEVQGYRAKGKDYVSVANMEQPTGGNGRDKDEEDSRRFNRFEAA